MTVHEIQPKGADGSHRGLYDFYPEFAQDIRDAISKGAHFEWTTGWYSSKHALACARITHQGFWRFLIEVSVTDDFDTSGRADKLWEIKNPPEGFPLRFEGKVLEQIGQEISRLHMAAELDRDQNAPYAGFTLLAMPSESWVASYIAPIGDGLMMDDPPGDNYYQWGWDGKPHDLSEKDQREIEFWINEYLAGNSKELRYQTESEVWVIEPWKNSQGQPAR